MSIGDLIGLTLQDPNMLWAALGSISQMVEAVVVLVSAVTIIFQMRRMKQESIRDRIAGLSSALEVFSSGLFQKVLTEVSWGAEIRGVNWDELLDQLDLIGLLIEKGYTDEELFLELKGDELQAIAGYFERTSRDIPEKHWRAKRLLARASLSPRGNLTSRFSRLLPRRLHRLGRSGRVRGR